MKPKVVIFSSSQEFSVAEAIYNRIHKYHDVVHWQMYFGDRKTTPLWTFFKNLFQYDYAILILSPDSIVRDKTSEKEIGFIPKDNVIFELGATMARLGPQKTILVSPDKPDLDNHERLVKLPSYFDDVRPLHFTYHRQETYTEEELDLAIREASEAILEIFNKVEFDDFHAELPAQGLAEGYLNNFLKPVFAPPAQSRNSLPPIMWTPDLDITVVVVIPDKILDVKSAQSFFDRFPVIRSASLVKPGASRNIGIYYLERMDKRDPLYIFDVPTTLYTAGRFVSQIEKFWRKKDGDNVHLQDDDFISRLIEREITNFSRILEYCSTQQENGYPMRIEIIKECTLEEYLRIRGS